MAAITPGVLRNYLLAGRLPSQGCLQIVSSSTRSGNLRRAAPNTLLRPCAIRRIHTKAESGGAAAGATTENTTVAYRKQLKDETKQRKAAGELEKARPSSEVVEGWELTVGIEIHAQLNTSKKLFSSAPSSIKQEPNTNVAFFDLAVPGSHPIFQKATLIPALRAALALNCDIQRTSRFDRKHYFHWDQPAGYQITQFYEPFAKDGYITLHAHDGIAKEDGEEVKIGIKQIQMEQDTAKTITQPGEIHLLDFNRVGLPLIEIITLPQIHHPSTAAALVRKVQIVLNAVDACVLGMESGGLRADVNVSVRRRNAEGTHEYAGISGLGQRTEIKNLSSFKAVRDAIIAERDRQIDVLESGGVIEGETRGWTLGSFETKRLRGKEGEVDYRYMPDPDLAPVILGEDLISHLKETMGTSPDKELEILTTTYGLTMKDALSLVALNDGGRIEYFYCVVDELNKVGASDPLKFGRMAGNWVLHELGGLVDESSESISEGSDPLQITTSGSCIIPAAKLAAILQYLEANSITRKTAKTLLQSVFKNQLEGIDQDKTIEEIVEERQLWYKPMDEAEYEVLAKSVIEGESKAVEQILKGQKGKVMFLVGKMMRAGEEGTVDPKVAEEVIRRVVEGLR
jgi:aspartyl-tRNA(Asn)/glutamyl-tRNA(Gln) amidotransferase subunit B